MESLDEAANEVEDEQTEVNDVSDEEEEDEDEEQGAYRTIFPSYTLNLFSLAYFTSSKKASQTTVTCKQL